MDDPGVSEAGVVLEIVKLKAAKKSYIPRGLAFFKTFNF
jgi:hypothetical protein